MPGPTSVTTQATNPPQNPPPMTLGVIVENVVNGDDLADWEVREFIEFEEDETDLDAFKLQDNKVSGWLDAQLGPDEHRIDYHLLGTSALKVEDMAKNGEQYHCVFTQVFKKRQKGQDESSRLDHSGFKITHTVTWQNNQWEYFSLKEGAEVGVVSAGNGSVRNPAAGWARVPITV
ncbi:MAG TPA: hypothetical protein VHG28_13275 [Longimicrobiaceae bacterium]|nr:hypothetical protein [Longimicrobiaceae bacterium]